MWMEVGPPTVMIEIFLTDVGAVVTKMVDDDHCCKLLVYKCSNTE